MDEVELELALLEDVTDVAQVDVVVAERVARVEQTECFRGVDTGRRVVKGDAVVLVGCRHEQLAHAGFQLLGLLEEPRRLVGKTPVRTDHGTVERVGDKRVVVDSVGAVEQQIPRAVSRPLFVRVLVVIAQERRVERAGPHERLLYRPLHSAVAGQVRQRALHQLPPVVTAVGVDPWGAGDADLGVGDVFHNQFPAPGVVVGEQLFHVATVFEPRAQVILSLDLLFCRGRDLFPGLEVCTPGCV